MTDFPSLRSLLIPRPGCVLIDMDLSAADAQVVAWEADDEGLKALFRSGVDVHLANARELWGPQVDHDTADSRGTRLRDKAKLVHAINYGCKWRTLADHMAEPPAVAKAFIRNWLGRHPKIQDWHRRIERQLLTTRTIHNIWGFRRVYTDRPDTILPQALAWIGQSTVAITINKILTRIDEAEQKQELPCQILLQVHDNLICEVPKSQLTATLPMLMELSRIVIPYPDPLIIPVTFKISARSWAEVTELQTYQGVPILQDEWTGSLPTAA